MSVINSAVLDLKQLDMMAQGDTPIHHIDARAKVIVTTVFIICVISFSRYDFSALLPYFIFPVTMITLSKTPVAFIFKKILYLFPFIIVIGALNPLFDHETIIQIGTFGISGGWMSFASILLRSTLTVGTAFVLIATTGFLGVCNALERLGVPKIFAVQLLFIYRYIFVLAEEGNRVSQARELRSCGKKGHGINSYGSLIGHLLLRTWQRAERIYMAMLSRGFTGEIRSSRQSCFGMAEISFVLIWSTLLVFLRLQNISYFLGNFVFNRMF